MRLNQAPFVSALLLGLFLASFACPGLASTGPGGTSPGTHEGLAARLEPIIKAHKGKVCVAVRNLRTGESYAFHADEVMPTASLVKFPVMVEAYRQAASGKLDLGARLTLRKQDKVPGSGVLTYHFSDGASFCLRDAVRLMIAFSDNTATNLVLDAVGLGATAATMEAMGYPNTKIHSKVFRRDTSVFPERSKRYGLGSTTANEMIRLCEQLYYRKLVDPAASAEMLEHMRACEDKEKFPRFLPPGTKLAFKTGSLADTRTAAGILETDGGPIVMCVLSCDNEDKRWVPENAGNVLCADIAREVFQYYRKLPPSTGAHRPARLAGETAGPKESAGRPASSTR